jgi:hypothetical protein
LGSGVWGLGIGPIPNPQSPIPIRCHNLEYFFLNLILLFIM